MNWVLYIFILTLSLVVFYKTKLRSKHVLTTTSLLFISFLSWESSICLIFLTTITTLLQTSKEKAWVGIIIHICCIVSVYFLEKDFMIFKIGLSYYAIQNIGILLLSVNQKPQKYNFMDLLFANAFFAKFISGPILLPKEISNLKCTSRFNLENLKLGINRVLYGIFKKIVLADNLHIITDTVFGVKNLELKSPTILFASLLFTVEMYLNFSAYTDIALGIAKLFNINLKENFKIPLRAKSISDYWKKTHISLIQWLTQNFFFPVTFKLRKHPKYGVILGIMVTFLFSGLWHGLYAGFLIWGLLNGVFLSIEYLGKKAGIQLPYLISWLTTILLISLSNLFFVSKTWKKSLFFLNKLLDTKSWEFKWEKDVFAILGNGWHLEQQFQIGMILIFVVLFFILEKRLEKLAKSPYFSIGFLSLLTLLCFLIGNFNNGAEFIYMQF